MLAATGLVKRYQSGTAAQTILDGLDLEIASGGIVALLGASGSGKTTLLNLVGGIDRPDAGAVCIDGRAVHDLAEPDRTLVRRREIGFVFQFFNLIPTLTVGENTALPLELIGIGPNQAWRRAADLLQQVGLATMAGRYPETLSGGEQQRTAVARALSHRPKLLLADEPTGNLDQATGDSVVALLTGLARDQGTTVLIVTHSQRVAAAADRVLELHQGRLRLP